MNAQTPRSVAGRWIVLLLVALLLSCGDSGVGSGGSGFPTGVQTGTVNGFGSVIVDSTAYNDDQAVVSIDLDGEPAAALTADDVRLGMQIRLAFEQESVARSIEIDPQIIGRVNAVGANQIVVAGHTVTIVARGARATVFAGFDRLAALNPGDRVMVFGLFGEFGRLYATRIELGAPGPQDLVKISGTIEVIGLLRRSLRIDNQVISIGTDTRSDVALADLRIGDLVSVWANTAGGAALQARRLSLQDARADIGTIRRLIGFVRQAPVDGIAAIGRNRIDVSNASFPNGSVADLLPGRLVLIGANVLEDRLEARTVTLLDLDGDGEVSVRGTVSDLAGGASFLIRNTFVDIASADPEFIGGDAADLVNDVRVLVRGIIINGKVQARQIEFQR